MGSEQGRARWLNMSEVTWNFYPPKLTPITLFKESKGSEEFHGGDVIIHRYITYHSLSLCQALKATYIFKKESCSAAVVCRMGEGQGFFSPDCQSHTWDVATPLAAVEGA